MLWLSGSSNSEGKDEEIEWRNGAWRRWKGWYGCETRRCVFYLYLCFWRLQMSTTAERLQCHVTAYYSPHRAQELSVHGLVASSALVLCQNLYCHEFWNDFESSLLPKIHNTMINLCKCAETPVLISGPLQWSRLKTNFRNFFYISLNNVTRKTKLKIFCKKSDDFWLSTSERDDVLVRKGNLWWPGPFHPFSVPAK